MTLDKLVEKLLSERSALRSSDKSLILEVFAYYGFKLTPDQENRFFDMPSTESIRRVRQIIQAKGLYPADPTVKKQRKFRSMQMQQIAPQASPSYIAQTLLNVVPTRKAIREYR